MPFLLKLNRQLTYPKGIRKGKGKDRRLLAKLVALFKIRDYTCENAVRRVAAVRILSAVNSGF